MEICDGRDQDCDDLIDDGAPDCPCVQMNRVPGRDGIGHSYIRCSAGAMTSQSMARGVCDAACGGAPDCPYHLVKIDDMEENAYVAANTLGMVTWIGLELRGGGYVWHDGVVPVFTQWQSGATRTQNCVQLIAATGQWRDVSCNTNASTFCEAP